MERRSPALKVTLFEVLAQVEEALETVHVSAVLTPFLRIVMVADPPVPGAAVRLTTSLLAVPEGNGTLTLASVAFVLVPHGIKKLLVPVLA
jgi:hypothetical protein